MKSRKKGQLCKRKALSHSFYIEKKRDLPNPKRRILGNNSFTDLFFFYCVRFIIMVVDDDDGLIFFLVSLEYPKTRKISHTHTSCGRGSE